MIIIILVINLSNNAFAIIKERAEIGGKEKLLKKMLKISIYAELQKIYENTGWLFMSVLSKNLRNYQHQEWWVIFNNSISNSKKKKKLDYQLETESSIFRMGGFFLIIPNQVNNNNNNKNWTSKIFKRDW